jgi:hypothetical protein
LGTLYNRRAAIDRGFYTADISSSDMDSLLRLALEGNVLVLNTIAGCWVQHGGNTSSNLPLRDIAANVRIFRKTAQLAAQRGLAAMPAIDGDLARYEAQTLVHLLGQAIGKAPPGFAAPFKMLYIVISIKPRLLLDRRLAALCFGGMWKQARLALKRRARGPALPGAMEKREGIAE